jgi:predicted nucleic acid-binding protein
MSDKYFLDTNLFVHCFDRENKFKRSRAETLVAGALVDHFGIISSQVVQEFLNVSTRKFSVPLTPAQASTYLETVLAPLCEIFPSMELYKNAMSVHEETQYSFYDSLIVAAALEANCEIIYSEDLHSGHHFRGLTIVNPFADTKLKK